MIIKRLINQSIQNQALSNEDAKICMNTCLKGGATPAQISSFFTSLLMRNFTHEEFDGIIKGINFPIQKFQNIDIDFYIYSYLQDNFSLAISLILSELNYFIYGKFKNLYLDNSNITDVLKESKSNQNEENLLNQHNIHLSLSDYNKNLKNIHKKYPASWWKGIPDSHLTTAFENYDTDKNKYGVKVGTT